MRKIKDLKSTERLLKDRDTGGLPPMDPEAPPWPQRVMTGLPPLGAVCRRFPPVPPGKGRVPAPRAAAAGAIFPSNLTVVIFHG